MNWFNSAEFLSKALNFVGLFAAILTCTTVALKFRFDAVKRSVDKEKAEERRSLDSELKEKTALALDLTSKLDERTRPKPFKDRLISCLNEINPQMIEELTPGVNQLRIQATPVLLGELDRLAKEPEAKDLVLIDWNNRTTVSSNMGSFIQFNMAINADSLK